jgi:hypothetical protein
MAQVAILEVTAVTMEPVEAQKKARVSPLVQGEAMDLAATILQE